MQKGQARLARAIGLLETMRLEDRQNTFKFVRWQNVTTIKGVVVALDAEPNDHYDHSLIPGISLHAVKSRLRENHFASPEKFWSACRDRKWLLAMKAYHKTHVPVKAGDVTYELPAMQETEDLAEERHWKQVEQMLKRQQTTPAKKSKRPQPPKK